MAVELGSLLLAVAILIGILTAIALAILMLIAGGIFMGTVLIGCFFGRELDQKSTDRSESRSSDDRTGFTTATDSSYRLAPLSSVGLSHR